jgi:hypothetical protein
MGEGNGITTAAGWTRSAETSASDAFSSPDPLAALDAEHRHGGHGRVLLDGHAPVPGGERIERRVPASSKEAGRRGMGLGRSASAKDL